MWDFHIKHTYEHHEAVEAACHDEAGCQETVQQHCESVKSCVNYAQG